MIATVFSNENYQELSFYFAAVLSFGYGKVKTTRGTISRQKTIPAEKVPLTSLPHAPVVVVVLVVHDCVCCGMGGCRAPRDQTECKKW